jgi:hypothetical protein
MPAPDTAAPLRRAVVALTPVELFDELEHAIAAAESTARWWRSRNRTVVWFTAPSVRISKRTWLSQHHDETQTPHRYGYSLYQARQMRAALLPILAEYMRALPGAVGAVHRPHGSHPEH